MIKEIQVLAFLIFFVSVVAGFALFSDKVKNEHEMTRAYIRQAVALERMAGIK